MKFFKPEQYQPLVKRLFDELSAKIQAKLPLAQIEHIGSSSIRGALSKGDLDIYVGVEPKAFKDAVPCIESLGFSIKENTLQTESLCYLHSLDYEIDVGIQLVAKGSKFENFLQFRDILNSNKHLRDEYNKLKRDSLDLKPDEYRKVKSKFVKKILKTG